MGVSVDVGDRQTADQIGAGAVGGAGFEAQAPFQIVQQGVGIFRIGGFSVLGLAETGHICLNLLGDGGQMLPVIHQQILGQPEHILGAHFILTLGDRGGLGIAGQAVGVIEDGGGQSQFLGPLVHLFYKGFLRAGHQFRQCQRSLVGGDHQHGFQKILNSHFGT